MSPSNSALRRYTTPTCTLQIVAGSSPVSRWVGQSATKHLRFILDLDDPQMSPEKRVRLEGNQEELEALDGAVASYVQKLLNQSPEQFSEILVGSASPDPAAASTPTPSLSANDSQPLPQVTDQATDSASHYLADTATGAARTPSLKIFLQQGEGLSHKLFLGPLATGTAPFIQLSTLQLFDMATALGEQTSDVDAVSLPNTSSKPTSAPSTVWATIAAVLLVAVGLTAVVQLLNRSNQEPQTARLNQRLSSNNQPTPTLTPTVPGVPAARVPGVPTPTVPGVPTPPLSSTEKIPLPPSGSIFNSPSPNSSPLGSLPAQPNPALPSVPQGTLPQNIPVNPVPNTTPPTSIFATPTPSQGLSTSTPKGSLPTNPNITPSPNLDLEAALSAAKRDNTSNQELQDAFKVEPKGNPAPPTQVAPPTKPAPPQATGVDMSPQVAEARNFFKGRWRPPSGLTTTLQYNLLLDVDGSIQRIEPLGRESRNYIDRTNIPLIGESFVSPNNSGQTPWIRVSLSPNGDVQSALVSPDNVEKRAEEPAKPRRRTSIPGLP